MQLPTSEKVPSHLPDITAHSAAETSHYLHSSRWTYYFPLTADVSVTSDKNGKNHAKLLKTGVGVDIGGKSTKLGLIHTNANIVTKFADTHHNTSLFSF